MTIVEVAAVDMSLSEVVVPEEKLGVVSGVGDAADMSVVGLAVANGPDVDEATLTAVFVTDE